MLEKFIPLQAETPKKTQSVAEEAQLGGLGYFKDRTHQFLRDQISKDALAPLLPWTAVECRGGRSAAAVQSRMSASGDYLVCEGVRRISVPDAVFDAGMIRGAI